MYQYICGKFATKRLLAAIILRQNDFPIDILTPIGQYLTALWAAEWRAEIDFNIDQILEEKLVIDVEGNIKNIHQFMSPVDEFDFRQKHGETMVQIYGDGFSDIIMRSGSDREVYYDIIDLYELLNYLLSHKSAKLNIGEGDYWYYRSYIITI